MTALTVGYGYADCSRSLTKAGVLYAGRRVAWRCSHAHRLSRGAKDCAAAELRRRRRRAIRTGVQT